MISAGILDRTSAVPLHEQLAHNLRAAILAGRAGGGEAVPSTRALAADLGIARGTAVAAYEILAGEGYLVTRPGGGTVVAEIAGGASRESPPRRPLAPPRDTGVTGNRESFEHHQKLEHRTKTHESKWFPGV